MIKRGFSVGRAVALALLAVLCVPHGFAGVSRAIQDKYRRAYENRALFLKVPIFAERQFVFISGRSHRFDEAPPSVQARFKVGDQVRVVGVDFGGEEIKFKLGATSGAVGMVELVFRFDASLQETFPNSDAFDAALNATFTEGLKYSDLEEAKRNYIEDQFERTVRELAASSGTSRDVVLKTMAPRVPAYQDALRDVDNLKNRNQELSGQVAQLQSENRKLDAELRTQQGEVARLKSVAAALQERIESSTAQLTRLGDELRSARGLSQGYQKELASLQKSLNLKIDANRDLASQIGELGQALRKIQKENEALEGQANSFKASLDSQRAVNAKLSREIEELKTSSAQMKETIATLTSKEDSLARQYIQLKEVKENLENVTRSMENLSTRVVEEKVESGVRSGKSHVYLRDVLLGSLDWSLPEQLGQDQEKPAQARFTAESIDYVRVNPQERNLLRTLGERLKVQVTLSSPSATMEVKPDRSDAPQEVGERESAHWTWKITNRGNQDTRLVLRAAFVNKHADDIPLLQQEHLVLASNVVRQVKGYLQPIPLAAGALCGFVLYGIFGIFRRAARPSAARKAASRTDASTPYVGQKKL